MSSDARNLLRGKDWIGSSVYQGFASSVVCTAAMRCIAVCDLCICICMAGLMEWLFAKEGWHGQRIALWLKSIKYKERWHSQRIVPWPSGLVEKYDFNPRQKNSCYEQSQHSHRSPIPGYDCKFCIGKYLLSYKNGSLYLRLLPLMCSVVHYPLVFQWAVRNWPALSWCAACYQGDQEWIKSRVFAISMIESFRFRVRMALTVILFWGCIICRFNFLHFAFVQHRISSNCKGERLSIAIVICDEYTWFSGGRDGRTKEVDDDGVLNVGKRSREKNPSSVKAPPDYQDS